MKRPAEPPAGHPETDTNRLQAFTETESKTLTVTTQTLPADAATADPRATWLADVRWLLGIAEAYPRLPLPHAGPAAAIFYLDTFRKTEGPAVLTDAEKILSDELGVTFRPAPMRPESASWFILAAVLASGLRVEIRALATSVATRHHLLAEDMRDVQWWVRIPVEGDETTETAA